MGLDETGTWYDLIFESCLPLEFCLLHVMWHTSSMCPVSWNPPAQSHDQLIFRNSATFTINDQLFLGKKSKEIGYICLSNIVYPHWQSKLANLKFRCKKLGVPRSWGLWDDVYCVLSSRHTMNEYWRLWHWVKPREPPQSSLRVVLWTSDSLPQGRSTVFGNPQTKCRKGSIYIYNLHLIQGLDFINFRFLGGPYTPKKVGFIHHSDKAISIAKMVSAHGRGSRCSKSWSRTIQYKGMVNQIPLVQLNVTSLHILELHL